MRIVSGIYGGRKLQVPRGKDIRPTSDKVRGAMFNVLRGFDAVDGSRVLDAFCGSGALGLEALSQGAAHVTFCDKSRVSLDLAKENAGALGCAEHSDFILKDALKIDAEAGPYDLAFLDPPYGQNLIPKLLEKLMQSALSDGAVCVLEAEKGFEYSALPHFEVLQDKIYGDTTVIFLRYQAGQ